MEKDDILNPEDFEDSKEESKDEDKSKEEKEETQDEESSKEDKDGKTAEEDEKAKSEAEEQKKKNAEYARKRREQEEAERKKREAKIREETRREVELGIFKENPYTKEPIKDEEDLEVYKVMKQLDDEGLNPIEDYPKRVAELNRKAKKEAKEKAEQEEKDKEYFAKDIKDFKEKYPDVDLRKLANDEEYLKFSEGKAGRWSTAEIYQAYLDKQEMDALKGKKKEDEDKAKEQADSKTKTPTTTHSKSSKTEDVDKIDDLESYKKYMSEKYNS